MPYILKYSPVIALVVAIAGPPAMAAAPDKTPADKNLVMTKIDTDNDGTVSFDEVKAAAEAKFDLLDTDKEGTLDASELAGIMAKGTLAKADTDKDATLDKAEYVAHVQKLFTAADTDKDGTLDAKELSSEAGRMMVALLAY